MTAKVRHCPRYLWPATQPEDLKSLAGPTNIYIIQMGKPTVDEI